MKLHFEMWLRSIMLSFSIFLLLLEFIHSVIHSVFHSFINSLKKSTAHTEHPLSENLVSELSIMPPSGPLRSSYFRGMVSLCTENITVLLIQRPLQLIAVWPWASYLFDSQNSLSCKTIIIVPLTSQNRSMYWMRYCR